jgi:hypothetical protein
MRAVEAEFLGSVKSVANRAMRAVDFPADLPEGLMPILRPHRVNHDVVTVILSLKLV